MTTVMATLMAMIRSVGSDHGWGVSVITRGVVAPYGDLSGPISDYQCHLSFEVVMLLIIIMVIFKFKEKK